MFRFLFHPARRPVSARRPTFRPRLEALEGRALPSFGFGWALGVGGAPSGSYSGNDKGQAIASDAQGDVYVAGYTMSQSVNFAPKGGAPGSWTHDSGNFNTEAFLAKYRPDQTLAWFAILGSGMGSGIALSGDGSNVYVAGTNSTVVEDFSAADGHQVWSTALAGSATAVAVGPSGSVYATGASSTGAAYVEKLTAAGAVVWTQTTSGGSGQGSGVAVDAAENVYVTGGYTGTASFGGTPLTSMGGTQDAYVWKLNADGTTASAGGLGSSDGTDIGTAVAVDGGGNVYLTGSWGGTTAASDFDPGPGVARLTNNSKPGFFGGTDDVFVVKLAPGANGSLALAWAKDIGGSGNDDAYALAVDGAGNVYTTGAFTGSADFDPGSGTYILTSVGGSLDVFVSELSAAGGFVAAGRVGGNGNDTGAGIAVDGGGNVYFTGGFRNIVDFDPTAGTYNLTTAGGNISRMDVFMAKWTQTSPQLAVSRGPGVGVVPLTQAQLAAAEAAAIREWAAAGLPAADLARMRAATADVASLGGDHLGAAALNGTEIAIDATADGWGWSVDPSAGPAAGRMDLVTVVAHELGHIIGLDSQFSGDPNDLMSAYLAPGERRLPGPADGVRAVHPAAPTASAGDRIDWRAAAVVLKPKGTLLADWLAAE